MDVLAEDQGAPIRSRGKAISSVFGWLIGGLSLFASLFSVSEAYGYAPSYVTALTSLVQGLLVLPPITAALRRRTSLLRPWWAPPVTFVVIGLSGTFLAHLAEPAGAARTALISQAISEATDDLKRGDTFGAEMRVANFDHDKSSNPALVALGKRIDAAEANANASSAPSGQNAEASVAEQDSDPQWAAALGEGGRHIEAQFAQFHDPIDRAAAEAKAGYMPVGLQILDLATPAQKADPRYAPLHAKLQAAFDAEANADQVDGIAFQIKTYWRPQLSQEPTGDPTTIEDVWKRETFLQLMAASLDDDRPEDANGNPTPMPPAAKAEWNKFRAEVAARQILMFPKLRRAYVKFTHQNMWLQDIDVSGTGRTITLTGAIFAANANIAIIQAQNEANLKMLRFGRSDYEWCGGCGGGSHYDLSTPADGVIARWTGTDWTPVKPAN